MLLHWVQRKRLLMCTVLFFASSRRLSNFALTLTLFLHLCLHSFFCCYFPFLQLAPRLFSLLLSCSVFNYNVDIQTFFVFLERTFSAFQKKNP